MVATDRLKLSPQSQWELAFVYAFVATFGAEHTKELFFVPDLQPEDLEDAITKKESTVLDELIQCFISNAQNRKKLIEPNSCARELLRFVNTKINSQEIDLEENPLKRQSFQTLPPKVKLQIFRLLVEEQLQHSNGIREIIEHGNRRKRSGGVFTSFAAEPIGYDSKKLAYWQFGDSPWLWREKCRLKSGCQWETVCRSIDELIEFAAGLSRDNRAEKLLAKSIEDIIPRIQNAIRTRERKQIAQMRKATLLEQMNTPRSLRPRDTIRPAKYRFDDEDDAFDEDENEDDEDASYTSDASERSDSEPSVRATRFSSRLNPHKASRMDMDM